MMEQYPCPKEVLSEVQSSRHVVGYSSFCCRNLFLVDARALIFESILIKHSKNPSLTLSDIRNGVQQSA